jgi:hypothetical protein
MLDPKRTVIRTGARHFKDFGDQVNFGSYTMVHDAGNGDMDPKTHERFKRVTITKTPKLKLI